jgi:hypothetical protein
MASETAGGRHEELTRLVMAAVPTPFWLDRPDAPPAREPLRGEESCDLAVVGGGFSGLWAALLAKEANPGRSVVLVEGNRVGWGASGRNGGFCEASLTHGAANGRKRFGDEFGTLQRLGMENLDAIEAAIGRYGIDCDFERAGSIIVATEDYQVTDLRAVAGTTFLDAEAVRAEVNSPTYLAGSWDKEGSAGVQPARLAWGLAAPASGSVSGSPSAPRPPAWPVTRTASSCAPGTACCGPGAWRSPPTRSRHCCGGCGRTSSRSTTTCW